MKKHVSETEEETEDYKNGNDSNNSSDNSTQTNGIQQSEKESYGIQFEPVGERVYMRKPKGLGGCYRWMKISPHWGEKVRWKCRWICFHII